MEIEIMCFKFKKNIIYIYICQENGQNELNQ